MLSLACAVLLAVVPQEPAPDLVTALLRCEVHGAVAFPPDAIRRALMTDAGALQLLQARDRASDFAAKVAERAREGYLRGGYAEAQVTGAVQDGVLRLDVVEGPRLECGELRCSGVPYTEGSLLMVAMLDMPENLRWAKKTPAKLDAEARSAFAARVQQFCRQKGRHGAQCTVDFDRDGDVMNLRIDVTDRGQEVHVGKLELAGERPEDEAEVRQHLRYEDGALFTEDFATDLRHQLERTGRYARVTISPGEYAVGGRLDPFRVHVQLAGYAPKAAQTDWQAQAQLQRGIDSLRQDMVAGRAVCFELAPAAGSSMPLFGHRLSAARLAGHVAADGLALSCDDLRIDDQVLASPRLVLRNNEVLIAAVAGHYGWAHAAAMLPAKVSIATVLDGDGMMETRFGIGFCTTESAHFELTFHPATAGYLLQHSELSWTRDGDALVASRRDGGDRILRVAADGKLEFSFRHRDEDGSTEVIALAAGGLDAVSAALRPPSGEVRPPLDEAATLLTEACARLQQDLPDKLRPALELVRATAGFVKEQVASQPPASPKVEFVIPGAATPAAAAMAMPMMATAFAGWLGGSGWPRQVMEALPALMLGGGTRADAARRIFALARRTETGPLARVGIAAELRFAGFAEAATAIQQLASENCTAEAVWQDLRALVEAAGHPDGLQQLGACWRKRPQLRELFADLSGDDADEQAARRGFQCLWEAGLGAVVQHLIETGK